MMKRPLCSVCLAFVAAVFVYLLAGLLPSEPVGETEGSQLTLMGELYNKEYQKDSLVLYLRHINKINNSINQNSKQNEIVQNEITEYDKDRKILCYMDSTGLTYENEPKIGSWVAVEGEMSSFRTARNPGEFDAALYYQTLGISFRLFDGKVTAQGASYSRYHEGLYRLRRYFEGVYDAVLSQKAAAALKAMVLGNRTELSSESKQLFQRSGISHILAISGLHISFIGMLVYGTLKKLGMPRKLSAPFCIALIIAYGDMVGMSGSAYRAVFMFGIKLLADMIGRTYDMLTALSLAAVLLVLEQPLYLRQSGFLLSFGAVLGIGLFSEMVRPELDRIRCKMLRGIAESISGSLSIFLIHFPILLCSYYEFPVYSFLLNLLIIPAMSVLLVLGLLCLLCGSIGSIGFCVAKLIGLLCHIMIAAFEKAGGLSLRLPFAQWITGRPDNWKIVVFYAAVIALYFLHAYAGHVSKSQEVTARGMKIKIRYWYKMILIIIAVRFLSQHGIYDTRVTFLDVGQGDGIWVESISGKHYLIDGGSTSKSGVGQYTLLPFLKYMGVSRLDAVFLTHLDEDHITGVRELLEVCGKNRSASGITIDRIIIAKAVIRDDAYEEIVQLCHKSNIPLLTVQTGDRIGDETLYFEVLYPDGDYKADSRNAYSLVMQLTLREGDTLFRMLLTGDVEAAGEDCVADYLEKKGSNTQIDVYKAAHHGSKYSNTWELLDRIRPTLSVISCGENNRYNHPHEEAVDNLKRAGSTVLMTKDSGAVTVHIRNGSWRVEEYLAKWLHAGKKK